MPLTLSAPAQSELVVKKLLCSKLVVTGMQPDNLTDQ